MSTRVLTALLLVFAAGGASGCATSEQWNEWLKHPTHFATGDHLWFSLRNQGSTPNVRQRDTQLASTERWWGDPIVVRPEQIFQ